MDTLPDRYKRCSKADCPCENPQPLANFHKTKTAKDGRKSECAVCSRAMRTCWGKANPDKVKAVKKRAYYRQDPEKRNAKARRLYVASPKRRQYLNVYRETNRGKTRAWGARYTRARRALNSGTPGAYTLQDVLAKLELQGGRCYYCKLDLHGVSYHADHKIPLSKGGTNWPANICCACPRCNCRKNAKSFWRFLDEIAKEGAT